MAVFDYKALDVDSSAAAGTIAADSPSQARDLLRQRGLTVTFIRPIRSRQGASFLERRRGRASQPEVVSFIRELATLLAAGIPLLSAFQTLCEQHRRYFRAVLQQLTDAVAAGEGLGDAMRKHPTYFDELSVSIVQVGENTGELEQALKRLAGFQEKAQRLRSRVTTALIYPAVVCVIGMVVCMFLMTYVVPNLLHSLTQAGKPLPAITRAVKAVSDLLAGWWWLLILTAAGFIALVRGLIRTEKGRLAADRLMLRTPVFGDLIRKENTSRLAIVMAALLRSGLQFVQAIQVTRRTIRNRVFHLALNDYEAAVHAGKDIAGPLKASGVFSPMVVQMLAVGQQSGQLEDMLEQLADAYDQQVNTATQRLTALMEPLLIVVLAVVVGFIALATILPILEASNVL